MARFIGVVGAPSGSNRFSLKGKAEHQTGDYKAPLDTIQVADGDVVILVVCAGIPGYSQQQSGIDDKHYKKTL